MLINCNQNKDSFDLNGKILLDTPEFIYIQYGNIKDSAIVKNNQFHFKGMVDGVTSADLYISPTSTIDKVFYIENTDIEMTISVDKKNYKGMNVNFITVDTLTGTKTSIIQYDFESFERLNKSNEDWNNKLFQKLNTIIKNNPDNIYSGDLLAESTKLYDLTIDEIKVLYKKLDTSKQNVNSLETIRKIIFPTSKVDIGSDLYDFELPNKNGIPINTKKYRGSFLLIDFWASWCAPCRKQNPELLKIYKEFNKKGFELLGVSIDIKKDKWLSAIDQDGLIWENVIEVDQNKSKIIAKYNVNAVPHNFLISPEGKIIAIDIELNNLRKMLKNSYN